MAKNLLVCIVIAIAASAATFWGLRIAAARDNLPPVLPQQYFEQGRKAGYADGVNDALDAMAFQDPIRGRTIARKLGVERR